MRSGLPHPAGVQFPDAYERIRLPIIGSLFSIDIIGVDNLEYVNYK
jgi:hypothetical protein